MRSCLIICTIILSIPFVQCKRKAWKNLKKTEAAAWMLKDSSDQVIKWGLCQVYDPYLGGKVIPVDSQSMKTLVIHRSGKFAIEEEGSSIHGQWKLNQARTEILFISKEKNGVRVRQKDPMFHQISQVRKITKDTMILAWQGRHGYVEELYAKDCLTY